MATLSTGRGRRLRRLALLAIGWSLTTSAVFSGCRHLFTPAIPEPPSGKPIIVDYRSPEQTLGTMVQGIAAKGQGASAWLGAFADSTGPDGPPGYHQGFDPADLAFFEGGCQCEAPKDWSNAQEQQFYLSFIQIRPGEEYQAEFSEWPEVPDQPPGNTEATIHRHYEVRANAPDGNSTTIIAIGYADLTFTKKGDRWLITHWEDHLDPAVEGGINPTNPYQLTFGRLRMESTR